MELDKHIYAMSQMKHWVESNVVKGGTVMAVRWNLGNSRWKKMEARLKRESRCFQKLQLSTQANKEILKAEWETVIIVKIHNKEDKLDCNNYTVKEM